MAASPSTNPSLLSQSQLLSFLTHIQLPPSLHSHRYRPTNPPSLDLHFLTQLHAHTISTLPYENLSLHYNPTHTNSISPLSVFHKTIPTHPFNNKSRGRGGYCMELSLLYHQILLGLNYPVYTSMVRIRHRSPSTGIPAGEYIGCTHVVNILTLSDSSKYHIDIAFGGDGATRPLPLLHDRPQQNLGNQHVRLVRDWIPTQTVRNTEETKLWIYQYRNSTDSPWNSFYAFSEQEAMREDFEILNFWTSSAASFQAKLMLVVKFLRRDDGNGGQEIYGKRMLTGAIVKENLGGKTSVVEVCESEEQRVDALRRWFGIELTEEERKGIRGWGTEIKEGE